MMGCPCAVQAHSAVQRDDAPQTAESPPQNTTTIWALVVRLTYEEIMSLA